MRVLAFDASSTTGWAAFADAKACPVLGDFDLPSGVNYGTRNLFMLREVRALIRDHRAEVIAFEAPIFLPRDTWHTRRLLTGLANMVELAAEEVRLRCIEVAPSTAKSALVGPRPRGKPATKDEMVVAAVNMGWPVANHHQADACAVAVATFAHLARSRGW